jgi:hypothetical protein
VPVDGVCREHGDQSSNEHVRLLLVDLWTWPCDARLAAASSSRGRRLDRPGRGPRVSTSRICVGMALQGRWRRCSPPFPAFDDRSCQTSCSATASPRRLIATRDDRSSASRL